ncbi:MAG TPA: outer membrane protein assembly factor BamE [Gammaproteobacteria bacterium]
MQKLLICLVALLLLSGCAHKIDIQQGNIISLETLDKVKIGMDRDQVRFILGTPLLTDPFHQDRWDYHYSMSKGGKTLERYGATLHFSGNALERIEKYGPIPAKDIIRETTPKRPR